MTKLIELGWNGRIEREYKDLGLTGHLPGRVAAADRGQCVVLAETGARAAVTSGKLKHRSTSGVLMPAVGDWVVMREEAGSLAVEAILPRSSCLTRKASGRECQVQVIAVNLDKIFIVTAVGRDLSPRRIERQLARPIPRARPRWSSSTKRTSPTTGKRSWPRSSRLRFRHGSS